MPVTIDPTSFTAGTVGIFYRLVLTASGGTGPYTWALDGASAALPAGLVLRDNLDGTAVVEGTPTATASAAMIINATDSLAAVGQMSATLTISAKSFNVGAYPIKAELVVLGTGAQNYKSGGTSLGKVLSKKAVAIHREMEHDTKQTSGANFVDGSVIGENVTWEFILLERSDVVMGLMHKLTYNSTSKLEGALQSGYQLGHPVKAAGKTSRLLIRPLNDAGTAVDEAKPWFFLPYAFVTNIGPKQWAVDGKMLEATTLTVIGYWDDTNGRNHCDGDPDDFPTLS